MKFQFKSGLCVLMMLWMWGHSSHAQNIVERNWLLGNSPYYLVFDKNGREPVMESRQAVPLGTGGAAVITDQYNGDLLFYTDGQFVYDAYHRLVPFLATNDLLSGDTELNQAAVACPVPGEEFQYYIFTNADSVIQYSVADASLQGNSITAAFPAGDLVSVNTPLEPLGDPGEAMQIIRSAVGNEYWLISQNRTTFDFHVTSITASGFSTDTVAIFSDSLPGYEVNQFAYEADTSLLAAVPKNPNRNVIVLSFDAATGELTFEESVRNTGRVDELYDVEWSNDVSKMYVSVLGDSSGVGEVYQVRLDTITPNGFYLIEEIVSGFHRSLGLEKGIDGRIYHLYQLEEDGEIFMAGINDVDSVAELVIYDTLAFEEDFQAKQFPQCSPAQLTRFDSVFFSYIDSCQQQTVTFYPYAYPEPNNYFWDFGDETGSNAVSPYKSYTTAGAYQVTLTVELNNRVSTFSQMINILESDSVDLGNDTTICVDEVLTLDADVDGIFYQWSTGETTSTIDVDTAGTYWVNVTFANGCSAYDDIVVTEYGYSLDPSSQWYFGERAGLDFTGGSPVAILDENLMSSPEGCASISDVNGQLLFYTNGVTVWNKEHDIMVNGTQLGGDSTSIQSALIIPYPDDATLFYIFTTEEVYGDDEYSLKFSVVDMKEDTARGKVVIKGIPLVHESTERLAASSFTSPYLYAHEFGNNNFRVYSITNTGIGGAIHTSIGTTTYPVSELSQTGYLKFSPGGQQLAMLIPTDTANYIELYRFDSQTGVLSDPQKIDIEEPAPAQLYGLEFSGSGERLYVTTRGASSQLIQYTVLDSIGEPSVASAIELTKNIIATNGSLDYGALEMGPDGVIYMAIDNQTDLGSINGSNSETPSFTETAGLALDGDGAGRLSRLGLPNFIQNNSTSQEPSITVENACATQEVRFSGSGRDTSIEEGMWDFGDGTTTGWMSIGEIDTAHIYDVGGLYTVTLTLRNRCDTLYPMTEIVDIHPIPEMPDVPGDTALCGGTVTLAAWPEEIPNATYYWSNGETTREVTFTEPARVEVAIINEFGCSSDTAVVFIGDGNTTIDLGDDIIVCQFDSTAVLDANNIGPNFIWTRNGITVGEERTQVINTNTAGVFTYAVEVMNTITGCTGMDSVEVTVLASPEVSQSSVVLPSCGEANGSFSVTFSNSGSFTYELSGPVSYGPYSLDGPGESVTFENLSSGSYVLTSTNGVTGCSVTNTMLLEDDADFDMEATSLNDCNNSGVIDVILRNFAGSRLDVEVRDDLGNLVYSEYDRSASGVEIEGLDTGLYHVSVRQLLAPQCLQTDTVLLRSGDECYRQIAAPNAFSPNGNGMNETFFVYTNEYIENFKIYIFNRWGELVFSSESKDFAWDGTFQNRPSPAGAYTYKMVFTSSLEPELGEIVQYGSLTLVK